MHLRLRLHHTIVCALAALVPLAATATAHAAPELPSPQSTQIVPNVSAAGMKLSGSFKAGRRGWGRPARCVVQGPGTGCAWTTSRSALPPAGKTGIRGPFVLASALSGTVATIVVSAGDVAPNPQALRRWKTPKGFGFGGSVAELRRAYPAVVAGGLRGQWVLWGPERRTRTNFDFVDGDLNKLELHACSAMNPCS